MRNSKGPKKSKFHHREMDQVLQSAVAAIWLKGTGTPPHSMGLSQGKMQGNTQLVPRDFSLAGTQHQGPRWSLGSLSPEALPEAMPTSLASWALWLPGSLGGAAVSNVLRETHGSRSELLPGLCTAAP